MAYEKPDGKTQAELEALLREVFIAYPEYSDTLYGTGRFEDMVQRFATDNFYKLHYVAIAYEENLAKSEIINQHQLDNPRHCMTALKSASQDMELTCRLENLYLFESQPTAKAKQLFLVATEYGASLTPEGVPPQYEYFRARAEKPYDHADPLDRWENSISVTVCHHTNAVRFGPVSQVQMNPEGHRLGPALMAKVIEWLHSKKLHSYVIEPGSLSSSTVSTDQAREYRNAFYIGAGFTLSGSNGNGATAVGMDVLNGNFTAESVGHLTTKPKYKVIKSSEFYSALRTERDNAADNDRQIIGTKRWAHGHTIFAPLKRIVLWLMDCPVKKP